MTTASEPVAQVGDPATTQITLVLATNDLNAILQLATDQKQSVEQFLAEALRLGLWVQRERAQGSRIAASRADGTTVGLSI